MSTTAELQELHEAFGAFKKANDTCVEEVKKYGTSLGETKAQLEKLNGTFDTLEGKINARIAKIEAEAARQTAVQSALEEMEARLSKRSKADDGMDGEEAKAHSKAFFKALRTGSRPDTIRGSGLLTPDELKQVFEPEAFKTMVLANDVTGGYVAPLEFVMELIKNAVEFSPVRQLARVRATGRTGVQFPKRTSSASGSWVAETGTRSETTNPALGLEELRAHEAYVLSKVSKQDLEDAAFDLQGFLMEEFAEQFGVLEGTAFVSGNAVGKPEGLLTNASVSYVASGHATEITADGIIALYYAPKETYINNGTFLLSRPTLKTIRQLKDGTGNYIWSPGIKADARPATIMDRPYLTATDMPSIGAGTYPVLFGDFRRAYLIVDRVVMETLVDPYASKSSGLVEFSARKRTGGGVILPEAIYKLKIATS